MSTPDYVYMEDLGPGQTFTAGPITLSEQDIIAFAKQFDPQEFHTDPEKAATSFFGEHVASGWHTAAISMRLILMATPPMKGGMIGRQVDKISWPRPVKAGDALSLELEILETRPSEKNPAMGIMRTRNITRNQNGKIVQEMEATIYVPRRT